MFVWQEAQALDHREFGDSGQGGQRKIVLIGASIGRNWNVLGLPERIHDHTFGFEYAEAGGFDKSRKLNEILSRQKDRPGAVILKECAAYFPGNIDAFKALMTGWIKDCVQAGVVPVPATVVPVTRLHSLKKFAIDIVKLRNPLRQGNPFSYKKQRGIIQYNNWLRSYCADNNIIVLDLEATVRKSEKNRFLKGGLAKVDGLHLNKKGYHALDLIVKPTLEKIDWNIKYNSRIN
jgi:hypothetical protein